MEFLGGKFEVRPLSGTEKGEEWIHDSSRRPFSLDKFLGGVFGGEFSVHHREAREAFGHELDRAGVIAVRNAQLGFWFRMMNVGKVPFDSRMPLLQRGYHFDDEGENPHLGLFHSGKGKRQFGTAVASTHKVQQSMKAHADLLNPDQQRMEIRSEDLATRLWGLAEHLRNANVDFVDYLRVVRMHREWMRRVKIPGQAYPLEISDFKDYETMLRALDGFYDAVDRDLDTTRDRYVHDHDRMGGPSALFVKNSSGSRTWNVHTLPPSGAIPFLHGRTPLPGSPGEVRRGSTPMPAVAPLTYYLFGSQPEQDHYRTYAAADPF